MNYGLFGVSYTISDLTRMRKNVNDSHQSRMIFTNARFFRHSLEAMAKQQTSTFTNPGVHLLPFIRMSTTKSLLVARSFP